MWLISQSSRICSVRYVKPLLNELKKNHASWFLEEMREIHMLKNIPLEISTKQLSVRYMKKENFVNPSKKNNE